MPCEIFTIDHFGFSKYRLIWILGSVKERQFGRGKHGGQASQEIARWVLIMWQKWWWVQGAGRGRIQRWVLEVVTGEEVVVLGVDLGWKGGGGGEVVLVVVRIFSLYTFKRSNI